MQSRCLQRLLQEGLDTRNGDLPHIPTQLVLRSVHELHEEVPVLQQEEAAQRPEVVLQQAQQRPRAEVVSSFHTNTNGTADGGSRYQWCMRASTLTTSTARQGKRDWKSS